MSWVTGGGGGAGDGAKVVGIITRFNSYERFCSDASVKEGIGGTKSAALSTRQFVDGEYSSSGVWYAVVIFRYLKCAR
jgi:hypothetical protein